MKTITTLARSRVRFNKNRTLLTVIAITFTTILLMALGTCAVGLIDGQRQMSEQTGNQHAVLSDLSEEQLTVLKNHMDVEAVEVNELFASVQYGKMNGYLQYHASVKGEISHSLGNLTEGHEPEAADEICGPKAFFERMGVEPALGNTITIDFRPGGDQAVVTRTFTICGIVSQVDLDKLDVNDSRISYSAYISNELVEEYFTSDERLYRASFRAAGQENLNYDEMRERIRNIAVDIGYDPEKIDYNTEYLVTALDPGTEMAAVVAGLGLMIAVFSGLVIYSIYYVSVITDVQEIGKLKALGAGKKQIRQLLFREGLTVTALALPVGLVIGFLLPYFLLPKFFEMALEQSVYTYDLSHIHMFSLPVVLVVVLTVLLTVYLSLLKPVRMASRISPIEAIRYQENSAGKRSRRKGYDTVNVFRLCIANLSRNRKRTAVTLITMGLSCVLFMSLAGLMNSMSPDDIARRAVPFGEFHISLDYALDDTVYPENNLNHIQKEEPFSETLLGQIREMNGVKEIQDRQTVLVSTDPDAKTSQENLWFTMSPLSPENANSYASQLKQGAVDYDQMTAGHGVIFTADYFMNEYGLAVGDTLSLTVCDGDRKIPLEVRIDSSLDLGDAAHFLLPQKLWDELGLSVDATTDLYISVAQTSYESVKEQLQQITEDNPRFLLYALDEEQAIGSMSVAMIKYPLYAILLIIAVIGFINLINTMVTSVVTRKRELGILQALGLSDRQLVKMLAGEGMFFVAGTVLLCVTLGNGLGYLIFLWGKKTHFMSVSAYHYPIWETVGLLAVLTLGQLFVTLLISRRVHRESLVERIRSGE